MLEMIMQSKQSKQWQLMVEQSQGLIDLHPRRIEGHRHKGDALMMLGQQQQNDQADLQLLDESEQSLRKALGLCNSASMRALEKEVEQSLYLNAKLKDLKQRQLAQMEQSNALAGIQSTME